MNGYTKLIDVEGVEHTLYFGRQAVEEFGRRTEKYMTDNGFKIAVDMVYSGIANYMTKLDMPVMKYDQVYEMLEKLSDLQEGTEAVPHYDKQYEDITQCFWESKYGSEYAEKLEEIKKKVEQEIQTLQEQLKHTENTGKD